MRLRNIPRAEGAIQSKGYVVKNPEEQKGGWNRLFGNHNPIYIEIGMGKGKFILQMAKEYPQINFVGIERYTSVLLRAVERHETEEFQQVENVRFICMDARFLGEVFAPGEVEKIYLNFSDPWPKSRHAKRRLTSGEFLARYGEVLAKKGQVEFKTDNTELFKFSLEQAKEAGWRVLAHTYDLHHNEVLNRDNVLTEYEEKFSAKGKPINKMIIEKQ